VIKVSEYASWSTKYYSRLIAACLKVTHECARDARVCDLRCLQHVQACDAPADLVRIIVGYGATGAALLSPPLDATAFSQQQSESARQQIDEGTRAGGPAQRGVDMLVFVGSVEVGRKVAAAGAASCTPVVLELGGKDPFVVCDDADVGALVQIACRGAFQNMGQNWCVFVSVSVLTQCDSFLMYCACQQCWA
jgi:acyl-CoA reductase-like NAD-dependent aldehyde dehydrogenase